MHCGRQVLPLTGFTYGYTLVSMPRWTFTTSKETSRQAKEMTLKTCPLIVPSESTAFTYYWNIKTAMDWSYMGHTPLVGIDSGSGLAQFWCSSRSGAVWSRLSSCLGLFWSFKDMLTRVRWGLRVSVKQKYSCHEMHRTSSCSKWLFSFNGLMFIYFKQTYGAALTVKDSTLVPNADLYCSF